jgi:5-formyltetrahydrofolate cyclo-ligase
LFCSMPRVSDPGAILKEKKALRAKLRSWRATLTRGKAQEAATAVARHGLSFLAPVPLGVVAGFAALPEELDPSALLERLSAEGIRLALPVIAEKGVPLLFRAWAPGDAMDRGPWDIRQPKIERATLEPDTLLVPLLAFDRQGWRLGYGAGYYDRTLRALRARKRIVAVGIGYDEQEIDAVPHLDYDERLDWVLTPSGPRPCLD